MSIWPVENLEPNIARALKEEILPKGITSLSDPLTSSENQPTQHAYQRLAASSEGLPVRINLMVRIPVRAFSTEDSLELIRGLLFEPPLRSDFLRIGTFKLSLDKGSYVVPGEGATQVLIEGHRRGWQLYVHIRAPEAFDYASRALETAFELHPRQDARHLLTPHPADIGDVLTDVHPMHGLLDGGRVARKEFVEYLQGLGIDIAPETRSQEDGILRGPLIQGAAIGQASRHAPELKHPRGLGIGTHVQHDPVARIYLLDGFLKGIPNNGLGLLQVPIGLSLHDNAIGRIFNSQPLGPAQGASIDMLMAFDDTRNQGSSFQIKDSGVATGQGSNFLIGSQLHDRVAFDRDRLIDSPHLGGIGSIIHAHHLAVDKNGIGVPHLLHLGGQLLCQGQTD